MDLGLAGRVALVTGASRGIGHAIADALEAEGARVARASRTSSYTFDSADLTTVDPLVDAVESDLGPIDVFVANTGGPPRSADPLAFTAEQWETAHRTLVIAPMLILARIVPGMRERGFGRVLAVSSSTAREPLPGLQLSNANRPGLLAAFKLLARESAAHGVTFNAVLPGRIATDRLVEAYGSLDAAQAVARDEVPARRLGTPQEVAAAAAFLCSEPASYVTGVSVLVDGGLTHCW
ncbi:MAG TPA: SDR family oxidoreductase [Solirubrobacteraceae bacterium]|nr:SDR family oxidoreductase [Solirubrobacteraceae bacterium]